MNDSGPNDPDLDLVESIYDALEGGSPETALALARQALADEPGDDPVLRFLSGVALLELDRPQDAAAALERAADLDPDDAEIRANLALALFRACRFGDALTEARQAVEANDDLPDAHQVLALALERGGEFELADGHLDRAAVLDPESFPAPCRLERAAFEQQVGVTARELPEPFRGHLGRVAVTVEDIPSEDVLLDGSPPLDPELLGLFVGVPLGEEGTMVAGGELPPRILLFQRNLERCFPDPDELRTEIRTTLYHELGHYLGMDEDDLERVGVD